MPSSAIKRILDMKNVWAKNAELFRRKSKDYVLPEDAQALEELKRLRPAIYNRIHFDLLPDPIIGNIDAPVCLLLINPGFSPIDTYNYSSIDGREAVVEAGLHPTHGTPYKVTFNFNGKEEIEMLGRRRKVLLDSYSMKPGASFYAFDKSFNTVTVRSTTGGHHAKKLGSYLWYDALLNQVPEERRSQLMDLEFFPYHTNTFNVNAMIRLEQKHPECRMAHSDLRDALIDQFAKEGRIFIARTKDLYRYLVDCRNVPKAQVCQFISSGNMVISRGNIDGNQKTLQKVFDVLGIP